MDFTINLDSTMNTTLLLERINGRAHINISDRKDIIDHCTDP